MLLITSQACTNGCTYVFMMFLPKKYVSRDIGSNLKINMSIVNSILSFLLIQYFLSCTFFLRFTSMKKKWLWKHRRTARFRTGCFKNIFAKVHRPWQEKQSSHDSNLPATEINSKPHLLRGPLGPPRFTRRAFNSKLYLACHCAPDFSLLRINMSFNIASLNVIHPFLVSVIGLDLFEEGQSLAEGLSKYLIVE